jgi:hypothetical protein
MRAAIGLAVVSAAIQLTGCSAFKAIDSVNAMSDKMTSLGNTTQGMSDTPAR